MSSDPFSSIEVSRRRRQSEWRKQRQGSVSEISPEIAAGLFTHFKNGGEIRKAQEALQSLDAGSMKAMWKAAFPGIAEVVELAWDYLPAETIARRDGGIHGHGEPFTWPLSHRESDDFKFEWLRKLMIVTGPFSELNFSEVIRHLRPISSGQMDESDGDYFKTTTGMAYDSDAAAYAAAALFSTRPESQLALEVASILEKQLVSELPGGSDRAIKTAIICAQRPDLWDKLDQLLIGAGNEPGFQSALISSRVGGIPGAWLGLLKTIRDHQLLRFEQINEWVRSTVGIEWQWMSHRRDDIQPWLERWISLQESPQLRAEAFEADVPGDYFLALWGEAVTDGTSALVRIARPAELPPDIRVAAAHFLHSCPVKRIAPLVLDYATDPDLRVANIASPLLRGWRHPVTAPEERPARFERLYRFFEALPQTTQLLPMPAPFPTRKLDLSNIIHALATTFPDGAESTIEKLLPKMDADSRDAVVTRLNRYRLTDLDREIAEICHGRSPEEWQAWLDDNQGSQLYAQRRLLLKMLDDRSVEVAEHAFKAVKDFTLSAEEAAMLFPILAGKSARKHLFVTHLLAQQPPEMIARLMPELLASKRVNERLAALEILRRLAVNDATSGLAKRLWDEIGYQVHSMEEERALQVLQNALDHTEVSAGVPVEVPSLENAFGLVDPKTLIAPIPPKEHDIILHSPVTGRLIEALDQWLVSQSETMIPSTRPWVSADPQRLGDVSPPIPYLSESREENLTRFPPAVDLERWWLDRPDDLRDPDHFELIRLKVGASSIIAGHTPHSIIMLKALFGLDREIVTRSKKESVVCIVNWLWFLRSDDAQRPGWQDFLVEATETAYTLLHTNSKYRAGVWHQYVVQLLIQKSETPDEVLRRIWSLGRPHPAKNDGPFVYRIQEIKEFLRRGIATSDEVIWHLVGMRPFKDKYDRERAFSELSDATRTPGRYGSTLDFTEMNEVVGKVCSRVIDLELLRGETPEVWTHAAVAIQRLRGTRHLQRLLTALGTNPLTRIQGRGNLHDEKNLTRTCVLVRLISVCHPAPGDTPEEFDRLVKGAGVPTDRLLELALFRPVWTGFIEHATGIDGLRDAVGWIFAHTLTSDYAWEQNARELWVGDLGLQTPISADEFLLGAVDTEWFEHAHEAVGAKVWDKLYAAAKFASTGRGHTRARLFSDALLNKTNVTELKHLLEDKGNLDAALAVGLVPLPRARKDRQSEMLRRYEILQQLKARSKKSKAQRRASEFSAYETGVRNLARRAGFTDTLRFEWAMETEAAADLSAGSLRSTVDDVDINLSINPDGSLELAFSQKGVPLTRVPAAVKKHAEFNALKERMGELKAQAQRLRPALEDLMVRGVCLTAGEWQKLTLHPLAGPLLRRLVLASENELLGFPNEESLTGVNGQTLNWPDPESQLHIAHPIDFLPAEIWHAWQSRIFDLGIVQPFKQVFRELYLPAKTEREPQNSVAPRFKGQKLNSSQVFAILTKRGWNYHPEDGLNRFFRNDGITVWMDFEETFHHFREQGEITFHQLRFTTSKPFNPLPVAKIPLRVFSEAMRDADLIISVAHASGADPEATVSTVEARTALVRETCRLLGQNNVSIEGRFAHVSGKLGIYRIHLASGTVHRDPGGMIPVRGDQQTERGRIFLPFADEDPQSADILSRILLFAHDDTIRDPALATILRSKFI